MTDAIKALIETQANLIATQQQLINKLINGDVITNCISESSPVKNMSTNSASFTSIDIEGFCEWLKYHEQLSENTVSAYRTGLQKYMDMYSDISERNVADYKARIENELSVKTVNLRLISLNRYLKYIGEKDIQFRTIKEQKKFSSENIITLEQYNQLIDYCENNNKRWLSIRIKILGKTGARISEALKMRKADIYKGYCDVRTKGNKERRILFPDDLTQELKDFYQGIEKEYLFYPLSNAARREFQTSGAFVALLKDAAELAGIPKNVVYPHSFRHMFAINFLKNNGDLSLLADLLGHESISTTAIYTRLSTEQQQSAVNKAVNW